MARGDGRRVHPGAAAEPHLLPGQVLRLPAEAGQRVGQHRALRGGSDHAELPEVAGSALQDRGQLRGVGDQPLRGAALHALLPLLHAEGVGHPAAPDPGRLGGAAHQEPVAHEGGVERDLGLQRHRVLDRGVRLPAAGAWADVGARGRGGAGAGRRGAPRDARGAPGARGRAHRGARGGGPGRGLGLGRSGVGAGGAIGGERVRDPEGGPAAGARVGEGERALARAAEAASDSGAPASDPSPPTPRPPTPPAPGRRARARASRPGTSSTPWG